MAIGSQLLAKKLAYLIPMLFVVATLSQSVAANDCPSNRVETIFRDPADLFAPVDPSSFKNALVRSQHPKYPDRVFIREDDEYRKIVDEGGVLYLAKDQTAGFGIKKNGELISLFNNGTQKGLGAAAVKEAIRNGATHLSCWGDKLAHYYERFGFKVKEVVPWNEDFWINDMIPPDPKPDMYRMEIR